MSVQNDANLANFEELEGHCKLLSAKISSMTNGNTPVQSAIEDLEDYYERAIQMRVMHNTTLREEISEIKKMHSETMGLVFSVFGLFCAFIFFLAAYHYPQVVFDLIFGYWSYVLVGGLAFYGSRWSREKKKNS